MKPTFIQYLQLDPDAPIPLAVQLSQQLAWLIVSGKIQENDSLPSVRELGAELDINYHTVRAAYQHLKDNGIIATRQGKLATVKNYSRHHLAANSPRVPTFAIGVLLPNYSPYHAKFLQGLENATQDDPWLKYICDTHYYTRYVARYMDQMITKNVDGIIVTHFETPYKDEVRRHLESSEEFPPIVYADSPGMEGLSVGFEREKGAYEVTNHLLDHGHERIALITPDLQWNTIEEVYKGYKNALQSENLTVSSELIITVPTFQASDGMEAVDKLLELSKPPTAILTSGDVLAIGALKRLKEKGLHVPDDMAVAGYGETELATLIDPPLTTVSLPPEQMGIFVMELLRQSIAGKEVERSQIILDTNLKIRQSCGCSPQGKEEKLA